MIWMHNGLLTQKWENKPWYIKENKLVYSRFANDEETFQIDVFPTIADSTFMYDEYNTVYAGEKYFVIDGMVFWEN